MAIPVESLVTAKAMGRGKIPTHNPITNIRSFAASGTDIQFGLGVMDGDFLGQVKLFADSAGVFRGVAGYSTEANNLDTGTFTTGDAVPVVDQGSVMVYVEEDISAGDSVRIRHTDGTPGAFCAAAVATKTALIGGAEWRGTGASGSTVELFLSPPFTITADT